MEHAEETLARLVAERLKALETNPFAVERAAGLPADAVRGILRGGKKSGTTLNRAMSVCSALGLELYIGPPRETGPVEQVIVDGTDYAHIPLHDALLAAGIGACNGSEEIIDNLAFRKDWLKRIGVSASAARLARVQGDSMQPSLWPGDMILIDTRSNSPPERAKDQRDQRRSPIFALLDHGEARVKRIQRVSEDTLMLLSDNLEYQPEIRHGKDLADLHIIGKVVWWGHTHKE